MLWLVMMSCFPLFAGAQNQKIVQNNYTRNALTLLVLDYGDSPYMDRFKAQDQLSVTDKFDDNNLNYKILPANFGRDQMIGHSQLTTGLTFGNKNQMNSSFIEQLYALIKDYKVPNAIIAKEFNRQEDGSFNMDIIAQRGMYNANTTDYQKANATMRKDNALKDAGEQLLNNSYILIFDFTSIKTMTEVYNAMDSKSETKAKRTQNGYKTTGNAYLYRIDFNDSVYNNFLLSMWIDANSDAADKKDRVKSFDDNIFPIERIAKIPFTSEGLQYNADQGMLAPKVQKSPEQLFSEMANNSRNSVITNIEKQFSKFRVTAQITSTRPIGVKIGTKEGMKLDQRFFVYETRIDASGKVFSKRMGVIRSKSIAENRSFISDHNGVIEPSLFYQTAGRKLSNMGMYVEQKNDWGFGLCLGYTSGNMGGANLSLEFNIMSVLNSTLNLKSGLTALKIYVAGGVDLKSYDLKISSLNLPNESVRFTKIEAGLAKDIYFARNFHIGSVLGVGMETASLLKINDSFGSTYDYNYQTLYGDAGLIFGFNILHNLQFQFITNYLLPIGKVTEDKQLDNKSASGWPKDVSNSWYEIFLDRQGIGFGGGLRLQF